MDHGFWGWEAPNGPNTAFGSSVLLFDVLRVIVITLSFSIGILGFTAAMRPNGTLGQKARMLGIGIIFLLFVASGQYAHLGDFGHWRVIVAFVAAVLSAWGLWSYYKYEKPAEIKPYGVK